MLFDSGKYELADARELTPKERLHMAEEDFEGWFDSAVNFLKGYQFFYDQKARKHAAFALHQATEFAYNTFLLVFTRYVPNTHDLEKLGKRVCSVEPAFLDIFPQDSDEHKRCFKLLREAYVRGRYKPSYSITEEQLLYLAERVKELQTLTEKLCRQKIAEFATLAQSGE